MVYVDANTIIGTRIIVTFRERIPHKGFIKKKDLAIGTSFFLWHRINKMLWFIEISKKTENWESYRRVEGKVKWGLYIVFLVQKNLNGKNSVIFEDDS